MLHCDEVGWDFFYNNNHNNDPQPNLQLPTLAKTLLVELDKVMTYIVQLLGAVLTHKVILRGNWTWAGRGGHNHTMPI